MHTPPPCGAWHEWSQINVQGSSLRCPQGSRTHSSSMMTSESQPEEHARRLAPAPGTGGPAGKCEPTGPELRSRSLCAGVWHGACSVNIVE